MKGNLCKICNLNRTSTKHRKICGICNNQKHEVICVKCEKKCLFTSKYLIKIDKENHTCKQCKLHGEGNPNFGKRWDEYKKTLQSIIVKSKVDDEYRKKCSKGMKGKKVLDETKLKRKETMLRTYGRLTNMEQHSEETKKKIGEKSKLKFTEEYLNKVRKVNEERGNWIPLNKKDEYKFYRMLSDWKYQVLNDHTIGIEKLKFGKLYDKNKRDKNDLVRDHLYGRKNGFINGVFPELIRHPANCQLITHSENIKKSKKNNDSVISLEELLEKIKKWKIFYEEQEICLTFVDKYENGFRFDKNNYINKIYYENN